METESHPGFFEKYLAVWVALCMVAARAITLNGLDSQAALGTTMGLFWEVPIMLGLVYLGKKTQPENLLEKRRLSHKCSAYVTKKTFLSSIIFVKGPTATLSRLFLGDCQTGFLGLLQLRQI